MRRRTLLLALPLLAFPGAPALAGEGIEVQAPWARAALSGRVSAAYMTLVNHGEALDRLVAASSPAARTVELHTHTHEGGVMRMRPVQAIEVNPGDPAVLRPGGLHIMLVGLNGDLRQGSTIPMTLRFEKAGEVTIQIPVAAPGASGPPHAH